MVKYSVLNKSQQLFTSKYLLLALQSGTENEVRKRKSDKEIENKDKELKVSIKQRLTRYHKSKIISNFVPIKEYGRKYFFTSILKA